MGRGIILKHRLLRDGMVVGGGGSDSYRILQLTLIWGILNELVPV